MTTVALAPERRKEALEFVPCYYCGSESYTKFITAEDDLTGKPGKFFFVRCDDCGLAYQNPRIPINEIGYYYDDQYIAHGRKSNWGILTWFYKYAMRKLDRDKERLVRRYLSLDEASKVLDVGCGAGTFLERLRVQYGVKTTGIDFKDLSQLPALAGSDFRCGLFYEQQLDGNAFDLITMWHFLEHDYDPMRSLAEAKRVVKSSGYILVEVPRLDSTTFHLFHERWPGLQAPQHTVLYDKSKLLKFVEKAGLEVVDYLPYGAFPAYFYLFAGTAFKIRRGKGINLGKAIYPYFLGQILLGPLLLFERQLNLAMQTVVCRRPG